MLIKCCTKSEDRYANMCIVHFNPLTAERCGSNFKSIIFKYIIQNSSKGTRCEIVLGWMPQGLTNENATFVQAWRHQAIIWTNVDSNLWNHIYGVTRQSWQCVYVTFSQNYPLCCGQLHYVQLLYTAFVVVLQILDTISSCEYRRICE